LLPAGRFGPGWLLVREAAAVGPDCDAVDGAVWDGRFRFDAGPVGDAVANGLRIGALGPVPPPGASFRAMPAAVRLTLPALRRDGVLLAVPHLGWTADGAPAGWRFRFAPTMPASGSACFADH
jgi:tRNA(Ile)-lysidine synthase